MPPRNPSGHPARFNDALLPVMADYLPQGGYVLDIFAGTGEKLGKLLDDGLYNGTVYGVELEPYWASFAPDNVTVEVGDATNLDYAEEQFDAILTSPCYGNRMADSHTPSKKDQSKRNTYTHRMMAKTGKKLKANNAGAMQWGPDYRRLHLHAWIEAWRVLKPESALVLNMKDHVRNGERVHVTRWHIRTLERIGFSIWDHNKIPLPGNRQGENGQVRIEYESVVSFVKKVWIP